MRWSLLVSFLIHTAILIAAVIVLPSPDPSEMIDTASIPVELVTLDEVTRTQAMRKEAKEEPKPEETPAPPEPEEVKKPEPKPAPEPEKAAPPPPAPEPEPEPKQAEAEPEPEPTPAPEPAPAPEKAPEPEQQQAKPVPTPRTKPKPPPQVAQKQPEPKEEEFNPDEISALLNKLPDQERASPQPSEVTGTPLQGPADMTGEDNRVTASELEWLRRQISRCWRPPPGLTAAPNLVVRLRFAMDRNGAVSGSPQLLNSSSAPQFPAAADAAIRAVLACQPYDMPPEKYDSWSEVILNFDPSEMYGT